MNLVRTVLPTLALALSLGLACDSKNKPDGTNPPDSTGSVSGGGSSDASGGGSGDTSDASGGGDGGGGDGGTTTPDKPKTCDAKTADKPAALFGERVLIRPPVNVELVEDNPTMAVAQVSGGFVSACDATVDRMTILVFENDKKKSAKDFANEMIDTYLVKGGYTGGTKGTAVVDTANDYDISVEYPATGGNPASVLYIAVRRRHENFFALVYQTRPDEFPLLQPTFKASAATLLVAKP
ncbi:MAG: hypothetical protein IPH07_03145 [Deltaproteobacteria bacterium]|nr:hypothetical protein [Deltaproteobacteria bacterium]MBK8237994.1 hypothetical protein [Deltaproteobacteria bacterium]MBK8718666.1 hypothetical protein [Deltaproteobacteria bacterium]MBP7290130.1 hypothetical protein [Nannocystaceae bacterium]